jgi:hypothetical protein
MHPCTFHVLTPSAPSALSSLALALRSTSFWFDSWLHACFSFGFQFSRFVFSLFPFPCQCRNYLPIGHFLSSRPSSFFGRVFRVGDFELEPSVSLRLDLHVTRLCRSTNKSLSNKDFYLNTFRHLQKDDTGLKIWKSAAPLKCKIFIWLAHRCCLPTNVCRF